MYLKFPQGSNRKCLAVLNGTTIKFKKNELPLLQRLCNREMENTDTVSATGKGEDPSLDKDIEIFIDEHRTRSRYR